MFKIIPTSWSYVSVFCLIPMFASFTSMNVNLLPKVMKSFDFWLLFGYLTVFVISLMISVNDERIVAVFCGYIGLVVALLSDALPEKIRKNGAKVCAAAILIVIMLISFALFQEKIPVNEPLPSFSMGNMSYNSADIAFLTCFNCIIFLLHSVHN